MLTITVDTREPLVVEAKFAELGAKVVKETLPCDFQTNKVAFERKTIQDLAQSLFSGRLEEQVLGLAEYCNATERVGYLLISGHVFDLKQSLEEFGFKIKEDPLTGAVASAVVRYGVNILWICTFDESISVAYKIMKKADEDKMWIVKRPRNKWYYTSIIANTFQVSPIVANRLYAKFGSIRRIMNASDKELMSVSGVGPSTVARIKYVLDGKYEHTRRCAW